ncbi:efflux RND transporter periplasmic adaptor subunit [Paenibacillus cremeus]|nr:efflux RND transporter periplasmic adaptor subunit [Paenibacillus cremeus]
MKTISMLTLCLAIIAGCKSSGPEEQPAGSEQTLKTIKVEKVVKQRIADPVVRAGEVQFAPYDVIAKMGGEVQQVLKKRGDLVQEGDVIMTLDSSDAKFQRDKAAMAVENAQNAITQAKVQAQKEVEKSKAELRSAIQKSEQSVVELTRSYNKARNDLDVGQATKIQVSQAESQLNNARRDLEQLKQQQQQIPQPTVSTKDLELSLREAQMSLQEAEKAVAALDVKAPVSGILTEMPVEARMSLQPGAKIGLIQKLSPTVIKAQLTEDQTKLVNAKSQLSFTVQGASQIFKGKVSYLSKVIDPETKSYELDVESAINDMTTMKPGMKVQLQLTDEQDQMALVVPTYSIVKEGEDSSAFVLTGDTVEKRKLQLGRLNDPFQEVLGGVAEGELVITSNPAQLKDKEKVNPGLIEGKP